MIRRHLSYHERSARDTLFWYAADGSARPRRSSALQAIQTAFNGHAGVRWAICDRVNGQLIGTGGFWRLIKSHFRAEVGYELAPEWWGQGVMTEALGAMLGFGLMRLGLHRVETKFTRTTSGRGAYWRSWGLCRKATSTRTSTIRSRRSSPTRQCSLCSAPGMAGQRWWRARLIS